MTLPPDTIDLYWQTGEHALITIKFDLYFCQLAARQMDAAVDNSVTLFKGNPAFVSKAATSRR